MADSTFWHGFRRHQCNVKTFKFESQEIALEKDFAFDVYLCYSVKDRALARELANTLQNAGLKVWYEARDINAEAAVAWQIEHALEASRTLILCITANTFGAEWSRLETGTLRFRDPQNSERRFISVRFEPVSPVETIEHITYLDLFGSDSAAAYARLIDACLPQPAASATKGKAVPRSSGKTLSNAGFDGSRGVVFNSNCTQAMFCGAKGLLRVWDFESGIQPIPKFTNMHGVINSFAWSTEANAVLVGGFDKALKVWSTSSGNLLASLGGHQRQIRSVSWAGKTTAISGSDDESVMLWDIDRRLCLRKFKGHSGSVSAVAWIDKTRQILSGSVDRTLRIWDAGSGKCLRVLEGHTGPITCLEINTESRKALSGSSDKTIRLWDTGTGICEHVFEGHTDVVFAVAWNKAENIFLSASGDMTVRLWSADTGQCLCVMDGHQGEVKAVVWASDHSTALSVDHLSIRKWNLESQLAAIRNAHEKPDNKGGFARANVQYTNAKVLLVGESGAGKTGLSKRLASNRWEVSDSTLGAWATQWKLPVESDTDDEREIWLWDFGGQADQRLVHQLYMDETALTVLVFDGQKPDMFDSLTQWDRDLSKASEKSPTKLLVAGRIDAGTVRATRSDINAFIAERGYAQFLETSAKTGKGCDELRGAILDGIRWEDIPWRSSPLLFKQLKEEIVKLKDEGRILMRFNELRESLRLRMSPPASKFSDGELRAVLSLLAGPGVVWELKFGAWILFQPERVNQYAQAVIQTLREDESELGSLPEDKVLKGELSFQSVDRLEDEDEKFVLLAMHQLLVERGLCLREHTESGTVLVFPSYYKRHRPELVGHPAVLVSYHFQGFLDEIYATLVVRLHHTLPFRHDQLWRYAADFKAKSGKQLGVKLTRLDEGDGHLEIFCDPEMPLGEKILFIRYVHEHLLSKATKVKRNRHYVCSCGTQVTNLEAAQKRLSEGKTDIGCSYCDGRVPLWDDLETMFASDKTAEKVRELEEQADFELDNESKERALVGEVVSTVALAKQLCREKTVSDKGIDMEIEFKDNQDRATGKLIFLQLKSGDSHLRRRQGDGAEIFDITDPRHVAYWMDQIAPVMLVIRSSSGEIRWMEIREYLKKESKKSSTPIKHIVFKGSRFDVMGIRRYRDSILGK